ncbi:probable imidazolonepropionase isoform X3 [Stegostoma tigrinum]|uniref:probable imidazolonepropionase isoform X3 n=1 Tax=Stegostoma tigrinum TaxID=3053191 RepID=UPI0028701369|nr:probable imidazolonepropionase isoform X3 [Stegostoma tigrinum]
MPCQCRLLVRNAAQLVQVSDSGAQFLGKAEMQRLAVITGGSIVVNREGVIEAVGPNELIQSEYKGVTFDQEIDACGMCVLPGLVDAHTHPVWAGDRVHEFAMKLTGASYMEIHKAGGGIHFTVEHTRKASEEELFERLRGRLQRMVRAGTTLVECKTGYGLDLETETKMLRVIERARRELDVSISSTYCGAHSVPRGKTLEETVDDIIKVQLPKLKEMMANGEFHIDNIDVFCEKGVFDLDSTRAILQAGKEMRLQINFHGDELYPMHAAELGAELGALAISHLEEVSDAGIAAIATAKSCAVLLPSTAYILRWEHLIYQFGGHQDLIKCVITKGKIAYENRSCLDY